MCSFIGSAEIKLNRSEYLAYRYRWTLQCGPGKWHHSGKALTDIRWCQSHNVVRHIHDHTDTGTSLLCSHISQNAHMGWHLWAEGWWLIYKSHSKDKVKFICRQMLKFAVKNSRLTNRTLIHVLVAGTSYKASRTGANGTAIKGVSVTHCPLIAGVTHTCIIKVAQQTCRESPEAHMPVINDLEAMTKRGTGVIWQTHTPVFPTGHSQKNDATRSWQVAPLKQTAIAQSSMFSLQSSPVQPLTQTQVWPPMVLKQVPPLWQAFGCMRHSLTSSAQYCPRVVTGHIGSIMLPMIYVYLKFISNMINRAIPVHSGGHWQL